MTIMKSLQPLYEDVMDQEIGSPSDPYLYVRLLLLSSLTNLHEVERDLAGAELYVGEIENYRDTLTTYIVWDDLKSELQKPVPASESAPLFLLMYEKIAGEDNLTKDRSIVGTLASLHYQWFLKKVSVMEREKR